MIQSLQNRKKTWDWIMISVYTSLVITGWFMVYSTTYDPNAPYAMFDFSSTIGAQSVWLIIALLAFVSALTIDWKFWHVVSFGVYGLTMVLLIAVILIGHEINGAKSWIIIGGFSLQPSEVGKFATALTLSSFLSFNKVDLSNTRNLINSFSIFLIPVLLILLQPDFGSALVYFSFLILLYRKGMSPWIWIVVISFAFIFIVSLMWNVNVTLTLTILILGFILINNIETIKVSTIIYAILTILTLIIGAQETSYILLIPSLLGLFYGIYIHIKNKKLQWVGLALSITLLVALMSISTDYVFNNVLKPHQQERLNVWLKPEKCDPRGSLYNIIQSKLAIGSGGLLGKGFLNGEMTKLNYVPEQTTDFIFTSIGEEQGFIGILGIIILFTILMYRCIIIAERAQFDFIKNYGYGVFGIIFFHFLFNIGMTLGLLPVIGIPLPFISKGGSSLVIFSIMVGALVRMDMARSRV